MKMLNPAVRREAEWQDGMLSHESFVTAAGRIGAPLYVEAPEPEEIPARPVELDVDALRTMARAAEFRLREAKRHMKFAARELHELQERLSAKLDADARARRSA